MDGDGNDMMIFNAELTMQEMTMENMESVSAVDFRRDERMALENPVLEADLSYIMQNAIILDPEKGVDPESSSESDSSDDDDDDDVRITLVKDKKNADSYKDVVLVSSDGDDEQVINNKHEKIGTIISVSCEQTDHAIESRAIAKKKECEEIVVKDFLNDVVRKVVKISKGECNVKTSLLDCSTDDSLSSDTEPGHHITLRSIVEQEIRVVDQIPRVANEVLPEEVVIEVEEIVLTPQDHLNQIGIINGIVEKMVVVKSNHDSPALDCESAFFFEDRSYLGKVFDTFGPVKIPYYTINLAKSADAAKLSVGTKICYVPFNQNLTKYVFLSQLKKMKGSDASWRNDCEPPANCVDYSDDEEERLARKGKNKKSDVPLISNENNGQGKDTKQQGKHFRGNTFNNNENDQTGRKKKAGQYRGEFIPGRSPKHQVTNTAQLLSPSNVQKQYSYIPNQSINPPLHSSFRPIQPPVRPGTQPQSGLGMLHPVGVGTQPTAMPKTQPPFMPGTRPPVMPGTRPPVMPGTRPPVMPGTCPPVMPGTRPQVMPGTRPSAMPGTRPPAMPGTRPPAMAGTRPPAMPGPPPLMPGMQPPLMPVTQPLGRSGRQPILMPGTQPPLMSGTQPVNMGGAQINLQRLLRPMLQPQHAMQVPNRPPPFGHFPQQSSIQQHTMTPIVNQNIGNGILPVLLPQQQQNGNIHNQQNFYPRFSSGLSMSNPTLHTQTGQLMNNQSSNILVNNAMLAQNFFNQQSHPINSSNQTISQNNFQVSNTNNFPLGGSNFNSSSNSSYQNQTVSNNKDRGVVKLNGFTFKI